MSGSRSSESHAAELRCISVRQAPRRTAASVRSSQASTSTRRASFALKSPRMARTPISVPPMAWLSDFWLCSTLTPSSLSTFNSKTPKGLVTRDASDLSWSLLRITLV